MQQVQDRLHGLLTMFIEPTHNPLPINSRMINSSIKYKIFLDSEPDGRAMMYAGSGLSFIHNNSYYLTGVTNTHAIKSIELCTKVQYYIQWIRELYNKHK